MYGLSTPLSKTLEEPEFDSISSILANSGLRQSAPWKSAVDQKGNLFYVELDGLKNGTILQSESEILIQTSLSCKCKCRCSYNNVNTFPNTLPRSAKVSGIGTLSLLTKLKKGDNDSQVAKIINDEFSDGLSSTEKVNDTRISNGHQKFVNKFGTPAFQEWTDKLCQSVADPKPPSCTCKCKCSQSRFHTWSSRKTHNHNMDGVITEVYISINSNIALKGCKRHSSLCEKLLGIVPGVLPTQCPVDVKNNRKNSQKNGTSENRAGQVIVNGLIPDSSALRCRKIKTGQVLLTVNDCKVSWSTLEAVLTELQTTRLSNKVKLTLKSLPVHEACIPVLRKRNLQSGKVISHAVKGDNCNTLPPDGTVLYLTLDEIESEESKGKEDILYQFPHTSSAVEATRGAFITLSHTLKDVTNTPTKSSTILIDSRQTQVCYHVEGRNLLVMTAPGDRETGRRLESVLSDIIRLLYLQYESIDSAFTDPQNHSSLDLLFTLIYECFLISHSTDRVLSPHLSPLHSAQWLPLSENLKDELSTKLSNFEAADFAEKSDDNYGLRRTYTILGSCVFYKGYGITSHLPASDLQDIHLFLTYHGLLHMGISQPVKQVVLWQEIYPTRRCQDVPHRHVFGYFEPDGRWFLLVVGVESGLLCVVMETGGCTSRLEGTPAPDGFYIDQAKATLLQIMSSHLIQQCELRLQLSSPPTLSADWFYNGKQNNLQPNNSWGAGLLTQISNPTGSMKRSNSLDKTGGVVAPVFKRSVSLDNYTPEVAVSEVGKSELLSRTTDQRSPSADLKSTCVSKEGAVFHYVYLDSVEGVFISSSSSRPHGPVHTELTRNFHQACLSIKKLFNLSKCVQSILDENKEPTFGVDVTYDLVEEHGILFQYSPETPRPGKKSVSLTYWVVGRVFCRPVRRELYVCFHESMPQNLVELAFKLNFGRSIL